jgi:SAM-dependent methyltransferase
MNEAKAMPKKRGIFLRFRDWNVRASDATTPHQLWETRAFAIYEWVGRALLGEAGANVVADVGGGRTWYFGDSYRANPKFKLIGIDVDGAELSLNKSLDQAVVADVGASLSVPDNSIDLILSRATVEHIADNQGFLNNVNKALRPGGKAAFVFANKWAPPLILNRIIGNRIANILLLALVPGTKGYGGFKAYYDLCSYSEFKRAIAAAGLEIEYEYCSYYSSAYFQFFAPLHFLSILFDLFRQAISIKNFSSMNLFVVRKPLSTKTKALLT